MNNTLESFSRIDGIRIMKLIELSQFTIIGMILGAISGTIISTYITVPYDIENYVTEEYPKERGNRNPLLWFHLIIDMIVVATTTYYIKKLLKMIPFFFGFLNKKYISGMKGESNIGLTTGLGFIYLRVLKNFQSRLSLLLDGIKV